jgi:hypothetical protein
MTDGLLHRPPSRSERGGSTAYRVFDAEIAGARHARGERGWRSLVRGSRAKHIRVAWQCQAMLVLWLRGLGEGVRAGRVCVSRHGPWWL